MELQHHRHLLNDIRSAFNVESKITSSFIVDKLFSMEKSTRRLEDHLTGDAPASTAPDSPKGIIRFSMNSKSLPKCASLVDVNTAFFADNCYAGYVLDTKSASYDELCPQGKKSLPNKFATIKRAVRIVLLHADSYPLKPKNASHHKDLIRGIATTAEKRLRETLGFEDKETVSVTNWKSN